MARVMPAGLGELVDERQAALEALERLEGDHRAGLLDEDDYRLLLDEATVRAARALRALEAAGGLREGSEPGAGEERGSPAGDASEGALPDEPAAEAPAPSDGRRAETAPPVSEPTGDQSAGAQLTSSEPLAVGVGGSGEQHRQRSVSSGGRSGTSPRPRRRRWLLGGSVAAFAVAAGVLVGSFATNRLPGQTISGSVRVSSEQRIAEQLVQGRELVAEGRDVVALRLFRTILSEDAGQPEALAYEGWLLRLAGDQAHEPGLVADGRSLISEAIQLDPTYPDAHLFLGLLLAEDDHDLRDAVIQLRLFLADHPSTALVQRAGPQIDAAFHEAGLAPPVPRSGH